MSKFISGTFVFSVLIAISIVARVEQVFFKEQLEAQRQWLKQYRFQRSDSLFCRFCRAIPNDCPAKQIGLPPLCELNPLFTELLYMRCKALDISDQQIWIDQSMTMI